jgi:tetratricopeptide (TPR) repeat protein
MDLVEGLKTAARLRLEGDLPRAVAACEALLAAHPDQADALGILAACKTEMGQADAAAQDIARAVELAPLDPIIRMHASVVFEGQGRAEAALEAARMACDLGRDRFEVWGRCGDLAGRMGRFEEAEKALSEAFKLAPQHAAIALRLAGARMEIGDHEGVARVLDRLPPELAGHPETQRLRMVVSRQRGDWASMQAQAEAVLAAIPDEEEAMSGLAFALGQQGYYNKATRIYRQVVERNPNDAERWAALGRFRLGARDLEDAQACFKQAMLRDPNSVEANFGSARLATFRGELGQAEAFCRRCLELDPDFAEAYGQLCEVSGGKVSDAELERLEALTARKELPADKQAIALFALGDIRHARKLSDSAFDAWEAANAARLSRLSKNRQGYSAPGQERTTRDLSSFFAGPVEPGAARIDGPQPIFIIGMPRSGTTLLENIIAAHPRVASGGELPLLPFIVEEMLDWARESEWEGGALPEDKLAGWRERYLAQYRTFNVPAGDFVTDKQPSNFLALGLIRQLFPAAPILHIRRNPVETGFSIYRRNFSALWPFADKLGDIAHYYGEYARLTRHWERAFPGASAFIQYETLVDEFEPSVRRLVEAAGLDFDPACLEFWKADTKVMTFSATQVRKPPSSSHKSSTERYRHRLGLLIDGLERAQIDTTTGALVEGEAKSAGKPGLLGRLFK